MTSSGERPAGAKNDCVVRAIADATQIPYAKVYEALCAVTGRDSSKPCRSGFHIWDYEKALTKLEVGFVMHYSENVYGKRPTLKRFVELNADHWKHPVLVRKDKHLFLVSRGRSNDHSGGRSRITHFYVLPDLPAPKLEGRDCTIRTYRGRHMNRRKVSDDEIRTWCQQDIQLNGVDNKWDAGYITEGVSVTRPWRRFQSCGMASGFKRFQRIYKETASEE